MPLDPVEVKMDISASEIMRGMIVKITITEDRSYKIRKFLATCFFRLGAWILEAGLEFEEDPDKKNA